MACVDLSGVAVDPDVCFDISVAAPKNLQIKKFFDKKPTKYIGVYLTLYSKFYNNIRHDNAVESICNIMKKYYIDQENNLTKYNNSIFNFRYSLDFTKEYYNLQFEDNESAIFGDYNDTFNNSKKEDDSLAMPSVQGADFYLYPVSTDGKRNIKLFQGLEFLKNIQNDLIEIFDMKDVRLFLYIKTKENEDAQKILQSINKKMSKHGQQAKNLSYSKNGELQFLNNELLTSIVGELL